MKMVDEGEFKKRLSRKDVLWIPDSDEKLTGLFRVGVDKVEAMVEEARKEFLELLEMVWASEYEDEHTLEKRCQLWPLAKKYWKDVEKLNNGGVNYQPYVDSWKAAKLILKWFGKE